MMLFPKSGYILHFLHFKLGTDFTLFLFAQHNLLHKHERWITAQQSFFTSCHHLIQSHFSNWNPIEMMMVMVVVVASPPVVTLKLNASKQCISVRVPHTHFCTHTDHNLPLLPWNKQTLSCSVFQCSCTGKVALTTTATTTTTTVGCNTLYLVSTAETFKLSLCVCVWQFHCQLEQMLLPGQFPIWLADSVSQSPASIDPITHSCISFFSFFFPFCFLLAHLRLPIFLVVVVQRVGDGGGGGGGSVCQILNGLITTTTTNTSSAVVPTAQNTTTTTTTADLCISGTLACDQVMRMTMMRMMMMRHSLLAQNRQK